MTATCLDLSGSFQAAHTNLVCFVMLLGAAVRGAVDRPPTRHVPRGPEFDQLSCASSKPTWCHRLWVKSWANDMWNLALVHLVLPRVAIHYLNPPPPFHWTAIPLRSWRCGIFSKIIPNRRGSVDSHTIWGLGASSTLPLRFHYASITLPLSCYYDPTTTMKIWLRLVYADGDVAATLLRPWRWSYAFVALLYPFNNRIFNSDTLLLWPRRFYCALAVSATIRVIFTKNLNRSGIAVQWNGGGGLPSLAKMAQVYEY